MIRIAVSGCLYLSGFSFWDKLIAMEGSFHRLLVSAFSSLLPNRSYHHDCQVDPTPMIGVLFDEGNYI